MSEWLRLKPSLTEAIIDIGRFYSKATQQTHLLRFKNGNEIARRIFFKNESPLSNT